MNCKNSTISTNYSGYFSNLKADDDIQSAPATGGHALSQGDNYNCISWAGGRVNLGRYFWPPSTYDSDFNLNDWYDSDPQQAFDNFFGNTPVSRFYEVPSYTRIGANESNAIVATWTNIYNDYTHGSVKKPGNNHPHGYDWESKIGGDERIFHPRDALENPYGYGSIEDYYTEFSSKSIEMEDSKLTFEESISKGLTILDEVKYSPFEKDRISDLVSKIESNKYNKFEEMFQLLVDKSNSKEMILYSNPIHIQSSSEFINILEFIEEAGSNIWPILYTKIEDGDEIALMLLGKASAKNYGELMKEVKNENLQNRYSEDGKYIAPSLKANGKKYVKKLLSYTDEEGKLLSGDIINNIVNSKTDLTFCISPNPATNVLLIKRNFQLTQSLKIEVFDISGKRTGILMQNVFCHKGQNEISIGLEELKEGIYLCRITMNDKVLNYKFTKE